MIMTTHGLTFLLCALLLLQRLRGELATETYKPLHEVKKKSRGSFRVLVLLVRFSDHVELQLPPRTHFENLCANEIAPYLAHQSYGHFQVEGCDVQDWVTTTNTESFFADGKMGRTTAGELAEFFVPALEKLEGKVNWSDYDSDGNGKIDLLLAIHSGFAAEQGVGGKCGAPSPSDRIVSQGHMGQNNGWMSSDYTVQLSGYAVASAFDRVCDESNWASMGVMTHEIIHTLRIPDLYDVGNRSSPKLGGIGIFDCMSNAGGPKRDGQCAEISAFTKISAGWVEPIEITQDGEYTARNSNRFPDIFRISAGFGVNEYLLIENRAQIDYDTQMPGSGILIFHVDEAVKAQKNPGFPGQTGWPENGNHYRVSLLPGDGKYDLEQLSNNGDAGDYWIKGQSIGPSTGGTIYPNTDSYQGGVITSTNVLLTILSDPGLNMKFRVEGIPGSAPSPTATPSSSPTISPRVNPPENQPTGGATFHWMPVPEPAEQPKAPQGIDPSFFMSATVRPPTPAPTKFNKPTTKLRFNEPTVKLDDTHIDKTGTREEELPSFASSRTAHRNAGMLMMALVVVLSS